jgi:hypothetical protein
VLQPKLIRGRLSASTGICKVEVASVRHHHMVIIVGIDVDVGEQAGNITVGACTRGAARRDGRRSSDLDWLGMGIRRGQGWASRRGVEPKMLFRGLHIFEEISHTETEKDRGGGEKHALNWIRETTNKQR